MFVNKHFGVILSFSFILFCFLISIFSYFIIPDDSQYSNQMHLQIHSMSPGFKATILQVPNSLNKKESYIRSKFFGNKFPNKEILIKKYSFDDFGINYENYNGETIQLKYNVFPNLISSTEIEKKYINLEKQLKSLIEGEQNVTAILSNVTAALSQTFKWLWVGFYVVEDNELVLGPFQGPVACFRIKKGLHFER